MGGGVLAFDFDAETGEIDESDVIALTDGVSFSLTPVITNMGDSSDNCPNNALELVRLDGCTAKLSGRLYSLNPSALALLYPTAYMSGGELTVDGYVSESSFSDIWFVTDYSGGDGEGFFALKLKNALSVGGIQLVTEKGGKGYLSFTFTGHVGSDDYKSQPFELYLKASSQEG